MLMNSDFLVPAGSIKASPVCRVFWAFWTSTPKLRTNTVQQFHSNCSIWTDGEKNKLALPSLRLTAVNVCFSSATFMFAQ